MSQSLLASRPLVAWMDVLDQIEQSLARSLAGALEPESPSQAPDKPSPLARLEERLIAWQARLDTAERQAKAAEERLVAEQAPLQTWVGKLGDVKQSFTVWLQGEMRPAVS